MFREREKNFALQEGQPVESVAYCYYKTIRMYVKISSFMTKNIFFMQR